MPIITINLSDEQLSQKDMDLIHSVSGLPTAITTDVVLQRIAKTAMIDYIKMFKDGGLPTRAADIVQDRLLLMIMYFFENIPNEEHVEAIFQITQPQSRTLLRNTLSRYRNKIENVSRKRLHTILTSAAAEGNDYKLTCTSKVAIDDMNRIIRLKLPGNSLITMMPETASTYRIESDTYDLLEILLQ